MSDPYFYDQWQNDKSTYDKNIPLHFQRKVIDEYCKNKGINNSGVQFENEFLTWLLILEHYIKQKVDGIVKDET